MKQEMTESEFWDPPEKPVPNVPTSVTLTYAERNNRRRLEILNAPGTFYRITIEHHVVEDTALTVEHYIKVDASINVTDDNFQDMYTRYNWNPDDGSPHDGDTYDYCEGHFVYNRFDSVMRISDGAMNELMLNGITIPELYTHESLRIWLDNREEYDRYFGYD